MDKLTLNCMVCILMLGGLTTWKIKTIINQQMKQVQIQ
jgi:hypothetical protein